MPDLRWSTNEAAKVAERREFEAWVRDHFGPEARNSGDCLCGRKLAHDDYSYYGGTFGYYACPGCLREWEVDINGAMWPKGSRP